MLLPGDINDIRNLSDEHKARIKESFNEFDEVILSMSKLKRKVYVGHETSPVCMIIQSITEQLNELLKELEEACK